MSIRRSYVIAFMIAAMAIIWVTSGIIGSTASEERPGPVSSVEKTRDLMRVRAQTLVSQDRQTHLTVRGRTEAVRSVAIRAETPGPVIKLPRDKGAEVRKGEVICQLSVSARDARMAEAEALMRQRWLEFDAAEKLAAKGHRSQTQVAAARASYDAAKALVKQAEVELNHTRITAPFDGILEKRHAEIGDYLQRGAACATIVDLNPLLVIAQVAENDVSRLEAGTVGEATLITGEVVFGFIRYIARKADEATRTFRIEMEIPNEDLKLRDGITAEISIPGLITKAHLVPPSALTLNDNGVVGVRIVDAGNIVHFQKVSIIEDSADGIWVTGLPARTNIITVGHEFVIEGQKVEVTFEPAKETAS